MGIFEWAYSSHLIFALGIVNLVSGVLVLFTCRCIPAMKITGKLMQHKFYSRIYKYHCWIWWIFWVSVIIHAVFAVGLYGSPF